MIPGYGRFSRQLGIRLSQLNKKKFLKSINTLIENIPENENVEINFVSFSGKRGFEDQLYSILSFYYNVGIPKSWTIYSDGTLLLEQSKILEKIPRIKIFPWDIHEVNERTNKLIEFSQSFFWGKRLIAYINQPVKETTIFTDSDIIFYKGFKMLLPDLCKSNWYIEDTGPHFDAYYKKQKFPFEKPVLNAGFLIYNKYPNWDKAIEYIVNREDKSTWEHFTDQAAIYWMLQHEDESDTLDPSKFILSCSDSFKVGFNFDYDKIAIRHFVGPVRHKMWQYPWKKILSVKQ